MNTFENINFLIVALTVVRIRVVFSVLFAKQFGAACFGHCFYI